MSKLGIIINREYFTRVRKKSFIVMTFLTPVLFVALILGTFLLSSIKDGESKTIVVADETNKYFDVLKSTDQYQFIKSKSFDDFRNNSDKQVYATLVISDDLLKNPSAITLYSEKQVTNDLERTISNQLNEYLSDEKIASYDIPGLKQILNESKVSINLQTKRLSEDGTETEASATVASIVGMAFTLIIYMFIFIYGAMVMQGVLEEKTNRIVEVMVSSVKPFDLMMGKIIGIGLVGLTQFFLWVGLIAVFNFLGGAFFMASNPDVIGTGTEIAANPGMMQKALQVLSTINIAEIILCFIIFFIGGYMIYASIFAAIGAMVNSQEDTQQFMMPISILVLFAFYAGIYSVENPDGPLAFWASMIPLTSPIVMMTRIPFDVPLWEKLVSIVLLFGTVLLMVKLTAKIYRVGILMYGKKPGMKEIIKWLKY
ncbi:MAG: ABC transporter permease [Dysgonamonadaceae bacterium]|jgi:ABC-2 type transport system permease protein|nr:ABC transporter permease [Dysgonamonadaceae bacterium]